MKSPQRYLIVIERAERNFSAYSPDLPGCVATGTTVEDAERNMRDAIEFHLEGLADEGEPTPTPSTVAKYVDVPAA